MVCRSAVWPVRKRSLAFARRDRNTRKLGSGEFTAWRSARGAAGTSLDKGLERTYAGRDYSNAKGCASSRERRRGIYVRDRAYKLQRRQMGADVRDSTAAARKCAPRGRLHSSAQLAMVEACPGRRSVHGLESQGRTGSARRRIHDQRHSASVCAGEFTRSVARGEWRNLFLEGPIWCSRCTT